MHILGYEESNNFYDSPVISWKDPNSSGKGRQGHRTDNLCLLQHFLALAPRCFKWLEQEFAFSVLVQ